MKRAGLTQDRGRKIYDWIMARLDEGYTVYASTHLKRIEINPRHRHLVRLHGTHCEVARGKNWDSINLCRIEAVK